jgi:hypothetical protein
MKRSETQPGGHGEPIADPVGMPSRLDATVDDRVRLVRIEWFDSCHYNAGAWFDPDDIDPEPCACITVGLLIRESADAVMVAHTVQESGDVTGAFVIPRSNIVTMETLAVPE